MPPSAAVKQRSRLQVVAEGCGASAALDLSKEWLVQVPSRDRPSTVIAFAQKTFKDGNLTSKLHVIELGAPAGASQRKKACRVLAAAPERAC